jgi:hypothetical protein
MHHLVERLFRALSVQEANERVPIIAIPDSVDQAGFQGVAIATCRVNMCGIRNPSPQSVLGLANLDALALMTRQIKLSNIDDQKESR